VVSTPVLMAFIWMAFIGFQPGVAAPFVALVVLLMYASYASLTISHLSWAGELQPDYHGRTRTLGAVQIAGMIGYVGMLALPALVRGAGGSADEAVRWMGYVALIVLPATVAWCVLTVKEAPSPPQPHLGFRVAMQALRENEALRRVLVPDFLIGVGYGVTGGLFVFLFRYHLGFPRTAELLLLIYFLSGLLCVPFWTWAGRRFGKHRALQWGCIHAAIMLALVPFMPKGDFWLAAAVLVFAGASQSAGTMLVRAMMADVVDEDTAKTGGQRSGLFFGLLLTTSKIGVAVGPLTYAVLDAAGFDAKLGADNAPSAMLALVLLYAGVPLALNLVAAASLIRYPLDEARQRELRAAIVARGAPAE
jgi:Na+/melibiose symporter-like transporter